MLCLSCVRDSGGGDQDVPERRALPVTRPRSLAAGSGHGFDHYGERGGSRRFVRTGRNVSTTGPVPETERPGPSHTTVHTGPYTAVRSVMCWPKPFRGSVAQGHTTAISVTPIPPPDRCSLARGWASASRRISPTRRANESWRFVRVEVDAARKPGATRSRRRLEQDWHVGAARQAGITAYKTVFAQIKRFVWVRSRLDPWQMGNPGSHEDLSGWASQAKQVYSTRAESSVVRAVIRPSERICWTECAADGLLKTSRGHGTNGSN